MTPIDIPPKKTFKELGLDEFGQAPLEFTGSETNKRSRTLGKHGLPANFIIDGNEGWLQKGQIKILLSPGQDIQSGLDAVLKAGGGSVVLNPGTYKVSRNLYVGSGVTLEGAGIFNTIIDFDGGAYSVRVDGEDVYSTGTVAVTQDSTTITGTGTAWTEEMVGRSILVDGDYYDIAAWVSATELTLADGFSGTNQSGLSYVIATPNIGAVVSHLTIQNSSTSLLTTHYSISVTFTQLNLSDGNIGMDIQNHVSSDFSYFYVSDCVTGIYLDNAFSWNMASYFVSNCSGDGLKSDGGGDATGGIDFGISNCGGVGMKFTDTSKVAFFSFTIDTHTSHGIEFVGACDDCTFTGGAVHTNGGAGAKLTATSDGNSFSQIQFKDNGTYGVHVANSSCDNNIIIGNVFSGNGTSAASDSGTGTLIRSNIGLADN